MLSYSSGNGAAEHYARLLHLNMGDFRSRGISLSEAADNGGDPVVSVVPCSEEGEEDGVTAAVVCFHQAGEEVFWVPENRGGDVGTQISQNPRLAGSSGQIRSQLCFCCCGGNDVKQQIEEKGKLKREYSVNTHNKK